MRRCGMPGISSTRTSDPIGSAPLRATGSTGRCSRGWRAGMREPLRASLAGRRPGEEDFCIVPLEAQACGRPVVAFARGGALETVIDGETGVFFNEPTAESMADALDAVARMRIDTGALRRNAEQFSRVNPVNHLRAVIDETIGAPRQLT